MIVDTYLGQTITSKQTEKKGSISPMFFPRFAREFCGGAISARMEVPSDDLFDLVL